MISGELTGGKVFFRQVLFCCAVDLHPFLSLLPPLLSFDAFAFAFLCQYCLQVLRATVDILRVALTFERSWIMQIRQLLC